MKDKIIAVVGVNDNPEKFGYKIFFDLRDEQYQVFAVGVRGGEVNGAKIYKTLAELPQKPDLVITVVPPIGTDKIVNDCINLQIKEIALNQVLKALLAQLLKEDPMEKVNQLVVELIMVFHSIKVKRLMYLKSFIIGKRNNG